MRGARVLIAGASIAGPVLALWLDRYGFDVTIVERAAAFRDGGQNVDVRGAAREVLRRSGLEEAVAAATTGEQGTRFLGDDGSVLAEFPVTDSETDGPTAEMEVLRGDLARTVVDALGDRVELVFGDSITALHDDGAGVDVEFAHGAPRRLDLVVAADGIRSSTRDLVFGDEVTVKPLGIEMSYLTIDRVPSDDDWWRWTVEPAGRSVNFRPDRHGTTRALLGDMTHDTDEHPAAERHGADARSAEEQRAHLRERFADLGPEAERVLAALDTADDLYFEAIGQVHAPHWTRGRFALTGDAAWCASPISGVGTSLAVVGAYVLAGELATHDDPAAAFAAYEAVMRPSVEKGQDIPSGPGVLNPSSRLGLAVLKAGLRVAGSGPVKALAGRLVSPPADEFTLPDYPAGR